MQLTSRIATPVPKPPECRKTAGTDDTNGRTAHRRNDRIRPSQIPDRSGPHRHEPPPEREAAYPTGATPLRPAQLFAGTQAGAERHAGLQDPQDPPVGRIIGYMATAHPIIEPMSPPASHSGANARGPKESKSISRAVISAKINGTDACIRSASAPHAAPDRPSFRAAARIREGRRTKPTDACNRASDRESSA